MKFKVTGAAEMVARLRRIGERFPDEVARALYTEAQVEMTEAKRRTPVKTGVLRASGHVQEPVRSGRKIAVTLAYGGAASAYAIQVHEDLEANHPRGGQAKFLESVLTESAPHMAERIARNIDLRRTAE